MAATPLLQTYNRVPTLTFCPTDYNFAVGTYFISVQNTGETIQMDIEVEVNFFTVNTK